MTDHIVARLRAGGYHLTEKPLHLEAADEMERLYAEKERLRRALATYACRCGDGECYKDEFVASCGRSAREALGLILNANNLNYAQEIAAKALEEEK